LEKALVLSPDDSRVLKDALYVYRILGKYSTAKRYAEAIITQYSKDPEVLLDTGIAFFETGSKQTGIGISSHVRNGITSLGIAILNWVKCICPWGGLAQLKPLL